MSRPRLSLPAALWQELRRPVGPAYRGAYALGWTILGLFALLVGSGVLLSFYYQPAPGAAAQSVQFLMRDVSWGWLVRGMHYWAAQLLIIGGAVQFLKVLLARAYRDGRAWNWGIGVLLYLSVLAFAATGQLLAWDQNALALARALVDGAAKMPLLGPGLAAVLRGGPEISGSTLSRAYSAHVLLLPWLSFFLLLLNSWFLARLTGEHAVGATHASPLPGSGPARWGRDGGESAA